MLQGILQKYVHIPCPLTYGPGTGPAPRAYLDIYRRTGRGAEGVCLLACSGYKGCRVHGGVQGLLPDLHAHELGCARGLCQILG